MPLLKRLAICFLFLSITFLFFLTSASPAKASRIEKLKELKNFGDFDLGPTFFYIEAKPGETITRELQVTNRSGKIDSYAVVSEDYEGSNDASQAKVLLGNRASLFGAKDWMSYEIDKFTLEHADRLFFNVIIKVPADATPGDHYAVALVYPVRPQTVKQENAPNVQLTSRVGSSFVIRVAGDFAESGGLTSFSSDKKVYYDPLVNMKTIFKNVGTVMLQPAGKIIIKDMFGRTTETLEIKPFKVYRESIRENINQWNYQFAIGKYTADLELDRGYGSQLDRATISFWIIPWKLLLIILGTLIVLISLIIYIKKRFHIHIGVKGKF